MCLFTVVPEIRSGVPAVMNHEQRHRAQEFNYVRNVVFVFIVGGSGMRVEQKVTGNQFESL